ncbi:hypothetical protein WJX74_008967 [Apatococcus lobatus]|uniref:Uncharacterized protein n=2 Tax=Apatococcus TaxID=904362 RepID=A0AAW1SRU3_9CHLO
MSFALAGQSLLTQPRLCQRSRPARLAVRAQVQKPATPSSQPQQKDLLADASTTLFAASLALAPFLADVDPAFAVKGEGGPLLEGRTVSLIHPATMVFLFTASLYAAYLGFQWRRTRTAPEQIKELKAQLPKPDADGKRPSSALDGQIAELEAQRKELTKGDFRNKHTNLGHFLLGLGVLMSVVGPLNTYFRAGKLFPGPHLYAGAAITVTWALAAALVPAMTRGNDAARTAHITLNVVNIGLFAWQIPTGFAILQKVFQFTTWP